MSAHSENPENFEAVRRLIALKRYEQPPPGYFNRLPGQIIARIEAGDGRVNLLERFFGGIVVRPALAYAFGVTVCGTIMAGIYSSTLETAQFASQQPTVDPWKMRTAAPAMASQETPRQVLHVANWSGSTNPVSNPQKEPSLFGPVNQPQTQPVSYKGN